MYAFGDPYLHILCALMTSIAPHRQRTEMDSGAGYLYTLNKEIQKQKQI